MVQPPVFAFIVPEAYQPALQTEHWEEPILPVPDVV